MHSNSNELQTKLLLGVVAGQMFDDIEWIAGIAMCDWADRPCDLERFLIESIRINEVHSVLGMQLTQAEIIATVLMLGGISLFAWVTRTKKAQATGDMPPA